MSLNRYDPLYPLITIKMTKNERLKKNSENLLVQHIKGICKTYGYECDYAYVTSRGEPRLAIYPSDRSFRSFSPDLYLRTDVDRDAVRNNIKPAMKSCVWKISTVSYGSLTPEEYKKMLDKMHDALSLANFLNQLDYSKLEQLPESFDAE